MMENDIREFGYDESEETNTLKVLYVELRRRYDRLRVTGPQGDAEDVRMRIHELEESLRYGADGRPAPVDIPFV